MLRDEIQEALRAIGLDDAGEPVVDELVAHAEMMLETNVTHNLTRITAEKDVAMLHVADSLSALPCLAEAPAGPFADIGSGAGYPGIPLAAISRRHLALVESRTKKAAFLQSVVDALGMPAEVFGERVEELPPRTRGSFAAVTARALAPLASLVELAAPLLLRDGRLIALKGEPDEEELAAGDRAAEVVGMMRVTTTPFLLAYTDVRRTLVVYRRVAAPRVRLPRRPGLAQHKPLG